MSLSDNFKNIMYSQFTQNFQDSYSSFLIPPQQNKKSVNLEKSIENLLESEQQFQNLIDSQF